MKLPEQIDRWLFREEQSPLIRFCVFNAVGIILWKFSSKGIQDAILWIAFLFSLWHVRRAEQVWKNAAGVAFIAFMAYALITLPFGVAVKESTRDIVRLLDVFASGFAITVLCRERHRIEGLLFYAASSLTLILTFDLVRLIRMLGRDLFARGHYFEPFILNHSNVASMAAGASFFVLCYFAWKWRTDRRALAACVAGMAVNLLYQVVVASRGPQIAFAVTVAVSGVVLIPDMRSKSAWLLVMLVAGMFLVGNAKVLNGRFADRATMQGFCGRTTVWKHSLELAKARPLTGYGYGKKTFEAVYHNSNPPKSPFYFHHTHEYWLFMLFSHGIIGVLLHASAWSILAFRMLRHISRFHEWSEDRLLPATVALLIFFIHVYGLGDWPDSILQMMLIWLVPIALTVTAAPAATDPCRTSRP